MERTAPNVRRTYALTAAAPSDLRSWREKMSNISAIKELTVDRQPQTPTVKTRFQKIFFVEEDSQCQSTGNQRWFAKTNNVQPITLEQNVPASLVS